MNYKQNTTQKSSKVRLTGLWKGTTKDGEDFLSGTVAKGLRVLAYKNKKKSDNAPDWVLYMVNSIADEEK